MEELEIFINLCTKKELVEYVKITDTKVNGFTRNFKNAPTAILKNSLLNELVKNNYKYFLQLIKAISNSFDKFNMSSDFSSFILYLNRNQDSISQAESFAIFLHRFSEKKDDYLEKIKSNIENEEFIFNIQLKELEITEENVDQKFIQLSGKSYIIEEFYNNYLSQFKVKFFEYENKKDYNDCLDKLKNKKWVEFVKIYPELIKNFNEKTIFLAYLDANQDFIVEYELELKIIHMLMIYELYLQIDIKDKEDYKRHLNDLVNLNDSLDERIKFLEKKDERDERTIERLEKKIKTIEEKFSQQKNKYKNENNNLKNTIEKNNKKLKNKNKELKKLKKENKTLINKDKLLQEWGESKNEKLENNLLIISYQDSSLYKLFFEKYIFINSRSNLNDLRQKLQSKKDQLIIINKAELNTQKLLEVESYTDSQKIIITSYTPKEFVTKTIKKLTEENLNIL